jgi:hypothetical protein
MPVPCILFSPRRLADRLCNVDVQHIQPVPSLLDPCQQSSIGLVNHHRLHLDVDIISRLVELADAHNILREPHDIVDTREQPVLSILAQEEYGPALLVLRHRVIVKRTIPHTAESRSVNAAREPDM